MCYEVKLNEIKLLNGASLAGNAACVSVYDKGENAFVLQKINYSNAVIKAMLMENKFDPKTAFETAAKEEAAEIAAARKETHNFMQNIVTARDILVPHKPMGYGTASHPITVLDDTLSTIRFRLVQHLKQNDDPREILAQQKHICQQAIKDAASGIRFIVGKRLLNAVATVLKFKPPFENLQVLDNLKKDIVEAAPLATPKIGR